MNLNIIQICSSCRVNYALNKPFFEIGKLTTDFQPIVGPPSKNVLLEHIGKMKCSERSSKKDFILILFIKRNSLTLFLELFWQSCVLYGLKDESEANK